jgi:hypothetical protein
LRWPKNEFLNATPVVDDAWDGESISVCDGDVLVNAGDDKEKGLEGSREVTVDDKRFLEVLERSLEAPER